MNRHTRRELRNLAVTVLSALLGIGLLAWLAAALAPQPEPAADAETSNVVVLSPAAPVVARRFDWALVLPAGTTPRGLGYDVVASLGNLEAPGVELVAIPMDGAGTRLEPGHAGVVSGRPLGPCTGGCSGGLDVIVHALPQAFTGQAPLAVRLDARLHAALATTDHVPSARASAVLGASALAVQSPSTATVTAHGSQHLRGGDPEVVVHLRLRVEPAALGEARAWPLSGRLHVAIRATGPSDPEATGVIARLVVAGDEAWLQDDDIAVDWLASCPPSGACDLPVRLILAIAPGWDAAADGPPPEVMAVWSIEARLEAFDRRSLPATALRLEEAP